MECEYIPHVLVSSYEPEIGPSSGGTDILITGSNFPTSARTGAILRCKLQGLSSLDGSTRIRTVPATLISETSLRCMAPYNPPGTKPGFHPRVQQTQLLACAHARKPTNGGA